jgi:hypothetical protein
MSAIRRTSRPRLLVIILVSVLVADLVGTGASYLANRDARRPLPDFQRGSPPVPGADIENPVPPLSPRLELAPLDRDDPTAALPTVPDRAARRSLQLLEQPGSGTLPAASRALLRATDGMVDGLLPHGYVGLSSTSTEVPSPWFSASAQGLALSAAVQLGRRTGDQNWLRLADKLFVGLETFRNFRQFGFPSPGDPWVAMVDDDRYLWFEQSASTSDTAFSLTAHCTALLAIYNYWDATRDPNARAMFRGGLATVEHYLPRFRVPGAVGRDGLPDGIRSAERQRLLIRQLQQLSAATGDDSLTSWAERFHDDLVHPKALAARRVASALVRGVDAYDPLPTVYGFPAAAPATGDAVVDPDAEARFALAALAQYSAGADQAWLERAITAAWRLAAVDSSGLYAHVQPARNLEYVMTPPWYSAETQGLVLSAFSRLAAETGDNHWRELANEAFATLSFARKDQNVSRGDIVRWVSVVDDLGYLWFERFPQGRVPSLTISSHITTTIGVYDYWEVSKSPAAAQMFRSGVATVEHYLPLVRVPGQPSRIGMATGDQDRRSHAIVTRQLLTLAAMSGRPDLVRAAAMFRQDSR